MAGGYRARGACPKRARLVRITTRQPAVKELRRLQISSWLHYLSRHLSTGQNGFRAHFDMHVQPAAQRVHPNAQRAWIGNLLRAIYGYCFAPLDAFNQSADVDVDMALAP